MNALPRPQALAEPAPLQFRRLHVGDDAAALSPLLGGRWLGTAEGAVPAPLLAPDAAWCDAWLADGALDPERRHGCVRYVAGADWLHGVAEIDDRAIGLHAAAQRAYADLFAVLGASRSPHPLRLWNYLADINLDEGGSERYRQFNAGRQQAFIAARRSAFEGAPAACALGTRGGPLRVYFLAGRQAPLALENPRQVSAYRYPTAYGPRPPTFSRAALVDAGGGRDALFVSGTASIVGHATVHAGDVHRQAEESLANIAALRAVAAVCGGTAFAAADLTYTVYLRHAADLATVRAVLEHAVGGTGQRAARDAVYLQADICRADLLVEIEAHAIVARTEGRL